MSTKAIKRIARRLKGSPQMAYVLYGLHLTLIAMLTIGVARGFMLAIR